MEQEPVCQSADSISGELSKIAALLRTDSAPAALSAAADQLDALRKLQPTEISVLRMLADVYFKLHRYEDAGKAVLLLFFEATRDAGSPEPRALDVAAFQWAAAPELDPARFPPADVTVLTKVRSRL